MIHILVSDCLLGTDCKWDGTNNRNEALLAFMEEMKETAVFHPVCPEEMGGLPTPRPASEVVKGDGRVLNTEGKDVTFNFESGAEKALAIALRYGCTMAILKERSPSCGAYGVYDGSFSHTLTDGMGKAAELLTRHGIMIFGETHLDELRKRISEKT